MHDAKPVLLDTHYWIWMQVGASQHFTPKILRIIEQAAAAGKLLVSVISIWEFGMLEAKGRIQLLIPCDAWIEKALATPGLNLAPLTVEIALESSRLPGNFHGDPADRIIAATVRTTGARLLTGDQKLIEYGRQRHLSLV